MSEKQRKLARHITVGGATYGPGDEVPPEVAELIRNPKAWQPIDDGAPGGDLDEDGREAGTASGHKLATHVTVGGVTYGPNDPVPDEVAAQIRNPKAWEGGKVPSAHASHADRAPKAPERTERTGEGDKPGPVKKAAPAAEKRS